MDKTLTRKMFRVGNKQHQGTGIASGLSYRPGYNAGGRVGFSHGGRHLPQGPVDVSNIMMSDGKPDPFQTTFTPPSIPAPVQSNVSADNTLQNIIDREKEMRQKNIREVDYSKFKQTRGDMIRNAALNFLKKRQEIIPAGTVGSPNQFLDLGVAMGDARQQRKEFNDAFDLKQQIEFQKQDTAAYDGSKQLLQAQITAGDAQAKDQLDFFQDLQKIGLEHANAVALEAATTPAKLKEIDKQMQNGKTFEEASAIVYGTLDNQMSLFEKLVKHYSVDANGLQISADEALQLALTAFDSFIGKIGVAKNLNINDLNLEKVKGPKSIQDLDEETNNNPDNVRVSAPNIDSIIAEGRKNQEKETLK